jgi:hypothetical protein
MPAGMQQGFQLPQGMGAGGMVPPHMMLPSHMMAMPGMTMPTGQVRAPSLWSLKSVLSHRKLPQKFLPDVYKSIADDTKTQKLTVLISVFIVFSPYQL